MKKGSYGSLESVSTNKYILRLMNDMKKLYMCNLEKVILFNIMKRTTTLLSALILLKRSGNIFQVKDAMTWWNGISSVPGVIIPVNGVK